MTGASHVLCSRRCRAAPPGQNARPGPPAACWQATARCMQLHDHKGSQVDVSTYVQEACASGPDEGACTPSRPAAIIHAAWNLTNWEPGPVACRLASMHTTPAGSP